MRFSKDFFFINTCAVCNNIFVCRYRQKSYSSCLMIKWIIITKQFTCENSFLHFKKKRKQNRNYKQFTGEKSFFHSQKKEKQIINNFPVEIPFFSCKKRNKMQITNNLHVKIPLFTPEREKKQKNRKKWFRSKCEESQFFFISSRDLFLLTNYCSYRQSSFAHSPVTKGKIF